MATEAVKLKGAEIKKKQLATKFDQEGNRTLTLSLAVEVEVGDDGPDLDHDLAELMANGDVEVSLRPMQARLKGT